MSRNMIELPGGGYATESEALNALVWEAKRRGTSYGLLVASTTERERAEIIRDYCMGRSGGRGGKSEDTNVHKQMRGGVDLITSMRTLTELGAGAKSRNG